MANNRQVWQAAVREVPDLSCYEVPSKVVQHITAILLGRYHLFSSFMSKAVIPCWIPCPLTQKVCATVLQTRRTCPADLTEQRQNTPW